MAIRTAFGLVVAALAAANSVSAEQVEPMPTVVEQVPMDVVVRLLGLESADQLTLGGIPEELAEQLTLPADVEVVGTVSHRGEEWSHDQIKGTSGLAPQELRQALADALEAQGWNPQDSRHPEVKSGFAFVTEMSRQLAFCGPDDASLSISVSEKSSDEGPTSFSLTRIPSREGSPCHERYMEHFRDGPAWAEDLVPVLRPPEGASSSPGGGGGSDTYWETQAHVQTDESADLLVNHYGGQLAAAGWGVGRTVALSNLAASEVSTQTPEGAPVNGFLLAKCGVHGREMCEVALSFSRETER